MTPSGAVAVPTRLEAGRPAPETDAAAAIGLRRSSTFVPELESVRGIAVLLVFAFHVDGFVRFFVPPATPVYLSFIHAGHTGVDLFFVLSAFLLSGPFLEDARGGKRVVVREYAMRRALRILPLYYAAVLVGTVLSAKHVADLRHAVIYLLFLNSFAGLRTPLVPYSNVWWSLATEVQFYLLLPLLPLLLRSRTGRRAGVALLAGYALAYAAVVRGTIRMHSIEGQMALLFSLFGRAPLFLAGIAAAAVHRRFGSRIRSRLERIAWMRNGGADLLLGALIVANAFFLQWLVSIGASRQMSAADQPWHIVNGVLWAGFILVLLLAPLRTKAVFSNPVLAWLGILSYSIYMVHVPFMQRAVFGIRGAWPHVFARAAWNLPVFLLTGALSIACVGLSALTYQFIERPFLVRKARIDS